MKLTVETTCPTQWKFEYESNDPELDELYEMAKRDQWNVSEDINWDRDIRDDGDVLDPKTNILSNTKFYKSLNKQTQSALMGNMAAFLLSQFLHGEQGALLCCGQIVDCVPNVEGKLYAATQVMDEARHVEVFHKYIQKLSKVYPITPALKTVLDAILEHPKWQAKCVGMQILVESLAMGTFKNMVIGAKDPLLKDIVTLTARDEARHVSFGIIALNHEIPKLPEEERAELEDFAYTAISLLVGQGPGSGVGMGFIDVVKDSGIDPNDMFKSMMKEFQDGNTQLMANNGQKDIISGYMLPNVAKVGLLTDRIRPKYEKLGLIGGKRPSMDGMAKNMMSAAQ